MKFIYLLFSILLAPWALCRAEVTVGAARTDVYVPQLQGKRIALYSNHTGTVGDRHTLDLMLENGLNVVNIFSPEHGFRGDADAGEHVSSGVDPVTGIPIVSLYGRGRAPLPLDSVDVIVCDIQDVGLRYYTYYCTMLELMNAAGAAGKEFVVLDRPNPLGGDKVEGLCTDPDDLSFVGYLPIPYIYGLTPGELARMIVGEKMLKSDKPLRLTVIPMKGWERDMLFEDTAMPWVLPSPHLPTPQTAIFYPATGIAGELDYLSIGVGYTLPFRTFAAPWIDADKLASTLNSMEIPGVAFRPIHYKPYYGFRRGENLQGVELYVTDYDAAPLTLVQFYVMEALAQLYPDHKALADTPVKRLSMFDKVTGSKKVRPTFFKNYKVADLLPLWNRDLDSFKATKEKYHLY